jgi:hypothetical protein
MAATFRVAMASDANSIEDRNALSPWQLRHCDVSRGLPRPPILSLRCFTIPNSLTSQPDATCWHPRILISFTASTIHRATLWKAYAPHYRCGPASGLLSNAC